MWLAERVWEPHLAGDLALEGIDYLCLDDTQFIQMGLKDEELERLLSDGGLRARRDPLPDPDAAPLPDPVLDRRRR